jgi:prephenate dehydrogenase
VTLRGIVAGGAGAVGRLMVELLRDAGAEVLTVDRAENRDILAIDEALAAELRRADVVVLALPERVALAAVPRLAHLLAPGCLLVDTLSVKSGIVAALEEHAGHLEALSLNPMFAPALGFEGRAVAAVVVHDGPRARALLDAIAGRGGCVAEVGADEHDRICAATQALTHAAVLAFGLALAELDVPAHALATPPHLTLLALLARIAGGEPETYREVQASNPHAARARAALVRAVAALDADFAAGLERAGAALGPAGTAYARLCGELFAAEPLKGIAAA